jgi:DNA polymerase
MYKVLLQQKIDEIGVLYGNPTDVISQCIRGFIIPREGCDFIGFDFNSIEARVTAWIAGDQEYLQLFRDGEDPYVAAAADIYSISKSEVTKAQRQIGKVAVLAFGFGGGKGAFKMMAKMFGIKATDDEADAYKEGWRNSHPKIVNLWHSLLATAIKAIQHPGEVFTCGHVSYVKQGSFLRCRLPSGRYITYPYAKVTMVDTPWDEKRPGIRAKWFNTNKWEERVLWYGILMENIVQGIARDFLVHSLLLLDECNYDIVLHCHDEGLVEIEKGLSSIDTIVNICQETPDWAEDFPLKAEGWRGIRYQK